MAKFTVVKTTREYETIFIVRPDAKEDERKKVVDRIDSVMERLGGIVLKRDDWGKRKLSYPINKNAQGIYYYLQFLGQNDLVPELERNLRLLEPVLKYLTVKLKDDVNPESYLNTDVAEEEAETEAEVETEVATATETETDSKTETEAVADEAAKA